MKAREAANKQHEEEAIANEGQRRGDVHECVIPSVGVTLSKM